MATPALSFFAESVVATGVSKKVDGNMKLEPDGSASELVAENRRRFFETYGITAATVVAAALVHGRRIATIGDGDARASIVATDGLITNVPGRYLSVTVADCVPVFFYDSVVKAVGLVHAGWRGLAEGIIGNTVRAFQRTYGSEPADVQVALGPHICALHYDIGADVANKFALIPGALEHTGEVTRLSLATVIQHDLWAAGVRGPLRALTGGCTYEQAEYFSYRRDRPETVQALVAFIGLRRSI